MKIKKFVKILIFTLTFGQITLYGGFFDRITGKQQASESAQLKQARDLISKYEKETRILIGKYEDEKAKTQKLTAQVATLHKEKKDTETVVEKLKKEAEIKVVPRPAEVEKKVEVSVAPPLDEKAEVPPAPPIAPPLDETVPVAPEAPPLAPEAPELAPAIEKSAVVKAPDIKIPKLKPTVKPESKDAKAEVETGPKVSAKLDPESGDIILVVKGETHYLNELKALEQQKFIEGLDDATLNALSNKILQAAQDLPVKKNISPKNTALQNVFNTLEDAFQTATDAVKAKFKLLLTPLHEGMVLSEEDQANAQKAMGFAIAKKARENKFGIVPQVKKIVKVSGAVVNILPASGKKTNVTLQVDTTVINSSDLTPQEFADKFAALSDKDRDSITKEAARNIKDLGALINLNAAFKNAYDAAKPEVKKIITDFINKLIKTVNNDAVKTRVVLPVNEVAKIASNYNITLTPDATSGLLKAATLQGEEIAKAKLMEGYDQSKFGNFKLELFKVLLEDEKLPVRDIQKIAFDNKRTKSKLLEKLPKLKTETLKSLAPKIANAVIDERDLLYLHDTFYPEVYGDANKEAREILRDLLREILTEVEKKKQMKTLTDYPTAIVNLINKDFIIKLPTSGEPKAAETTKTLAPETTVPGGTVPEAPPL